MNHTQYSFWMSPDLWPRDDLARGAVFLARAFDEIGIAQFGSDWKLGPPPYEPPPLVKSLPSAVDPGPDGSPEQRRQCQIAFRETQGRERASTPEWINSASRSFDRLMAVKHAMGDALANGALESRLRPTPGGAYSDILDASLWASERRTIDARFLICKMSAAEPFRQISSHVEGDWIFITRDSLERFKPDKGEPRRGQTGEAISEQSDGGSDNAPRVAALIKQDIRRLLEEKIQKWEDSGRDQSRRISNRAFVEMVTHAKSPLRIVDAKSSWADKIWRANKPIEWEKRGPHT